MDGWSSCQHIIINTSMTLLRRILSLSVNQIIDISTGILCITSAYKWTNTVKLHRFLWVLICFCLSPCSHTGRLYSAHLCLFLFCFWSACSLTGRLDLLRSGFFPEHMFSYSVFFLVYFGASVLILEACVIFCCFLQSTCYQVQV